MSRIVKLHLNYLQHKNKYIFCAYKVESCQKIAELNYASSCSLRFLQECEQMQTKSFLQVYETEVYSAYI